MTKEQREWLAKLTDAVINAIERGIDVHMDISDSSVVYKNEVVVWVYFHKDNKCDQIRTWYTKCEDISDDPEDLIKEVNEWDGLILQ